MNNLHESSSVMSHMPAYMSLPRKRQRKFCKRLTAKDAAKIKGMLVRGDLQSDIAAFFGVNSGRVSEINTGKSFVEVEAVSNDLPPSGPYHIH